jgi:hypothetical protein
MKINKYIEIPKTDLDDFTQGEQKLMMLMGAVQGTYQTDYMGMEKAITIRANVVNAPKIDALAEMSGLSKNLVINDLLELAFYVLQDNLKEEDAERFSKLESQKMEEWMSQYRVKESK